MGKVLSMGMEGALWELSGGSWRGAREIGVEGRFFRRVCGQLYMKVGPRVLGNEWPCWGIFAIYGEEQILQLFRVLENSAFMDWRF